MSDELTPTERPALVKPYFPKTFAFNLKEIRPTVIEDICFKAVLQYAAGMLVEPGFIVESEHSVTINPGGGNMSAHVTFREVFQVQLPALGRQFWMVVIQISDPHPGQVVGKGSRMGVAQFYVHNEGGWTHIFDYEHPLVERVQSHLFVDKIDDDKTFPDPLA